MAEGSRLGQRGHVNLGVCAINRGGYPNRLQSKAFLPRGCRLRSANIKSFWFVF